MKPLILRMQAFGPYADRAEIDFRRVLESGLFGIYGATGSGKSSIFSAMTFALFGEAAKGEQQPRTLRSDHADAALMTKVELIFDVGERRYRVVRWPDQMRPAKRGGGETEEKHKAWLFDATGLEPESLNDDNPGKPIAEIKVGAVDNAIIGLLGYEAAHFRQIVLLPQGRFETFLNAKTEDRVNILRELFDVSLYQRLTDRLKHRAKDVRDDIGRRRAVIAGRLASETFDSLAQLDEGISVCQRQCDDLAKAKADAEALVMQASDAYGQAAQTDRQFAEHAEAERGLKALHSQAPAIEADVARLKIVRAAAALAPVADAVGKATGALERATKVRRGAANARQEAEAAVQHAADAMRTLSKQAPTIEAERDHRRRLQGFAEVLEQAENMRRTHFDAEGSVANQQRRFTDVESGLGDLIEGHRQLINEREAARATEIERGALKLAMHEAETRLKVAEEFEKAKRELTKSRELLARAREASGTATLELDAARGRFGPVEAALLASHALHLAAHLEPGKPCPVCGSPHHPAPASGTEAEGDLAARYREAKAALERRQDAAVKSATDLATAEAAAKQRDEALAVLAQPEALAGDARGVLEDVRAKLAAIGPARKIGELDVEIGKAAQDVAAAQAELDVARKARDDALLAAREARTRLESALATIPQDLRAAELITAALGAASKKIAEYERVTAAATEASKTADTNLASAVATLGHAEQAFATATADLDTARARFAACLAERGLTSAVFETARGDIDRIEEIDARIRSFGEALAAAKDRLQRAEQGIAKADRPDIAALKAARDVATDKLREVLEAVGKAAERLGQLEKLHRELYAELATLDKRERETGPLRDLASLLAGENDVRTTLETFAIATMFDEVLAAANLRLAPMTRGRFHLLRGTEGQGRARRGLDILVEDSFTGRARPTSTLSGGETFIAALALALGLSDVVESTRGNVRLDAIFIDEGFGNLDSSEDAGTLDQVLQSLMELVGKRRAVGLISHVPLVQQTVQNGFWVTSSPSGSRIEERT